MKKTLIILTLLLSGCANVQYQHIPIPIQDHPVFRVIKGVNEQIVHSKDFEEIEYRKKVERNKKDLYCFDEDPKTTKFPECK